MRKYYKCDKCGKETNRVMYRRLLCRFNLNTKEPLTNEDLIDNDKTVSQYCIKCHFSVRFGE